jgi:hypothetical protein
MLRSSVDRHGRGPRMLSKSAEFTTCPRAAHARSPQPARLRTARNVPSSTALPHTRCPTNPQTAETRPKMACQTGATPAIHAHCLPHLPLNLHLKAPQSPAQLAPRYDWQGLVRACLLLQEGVGQRLDQVALAGQQRERALVRGVHDVAHLRAAPRACAAAPASCRSACSARACYVKEQVAAARAAQPASSLG